MLIDHGTFTRYTPATPIIPARPVEPQYPAEFLPVPAEPAEERAAALVANAAISSAYEALLAVYRADLAAWEASTATDRRVKAQIEAGGIFCKSGNVDWYTIALAAPAVGHRFVLVSGDRVAAIDSDPSRLWPLGYRVLETDDEDVAGDWRYVGGALVDPSTIVPTAAELIAYAARKRWEKSTRGISVVLPGGGEITLPSDDNAYGRLKGAAQDMEAGIIPVPVTIVIGASTFQATPQIAMGLYAAISQHWQQCFAVQGGVVDGINAGTVTTMQQIDTAFA